jgi:hypothetical protein
MFYALLNTHKKRGKYCTPSTVNTTTRNVLRDACEILFFALLYIAPVVAIDFPSRYNTYLKRLMLAKCVINITYTHLFIFTHPWVAWANDIAGT